MNNRTNRGVGVLVLSAIIVVIILISVAIVSQVSKTKIIERSISTEYDLRTYYVAMAGINECIANRMSPRSNIINTKMKKDARLKSIFGDKRVYDSGVVYSDPSNPGYGSIIGRYTFVSYAAKYVNNGQLYIDENNRDEKIEKYLVYSKGTTKLPNGKEDSLIIKALFDLSRCDEDSFNADEIEILGVLKPNDPELPFAEKLIAGCFTDKTPPKPSSIVFTTHNGGLIAIGLESKDNPPFTPNDINVRTKISINFNEPIDADLLDGITLKNVNEEIPPIVPDKVIISPKNTEVIIFPTKKQDGKSLNFSSPYKVEITGVSDSNGNIMKDKVSVAFNTEIPNLIGFDEINSDSGESVPDVPGGNKDSRAPGALGIGGRKHGSGAGGDVNRNSPFSPLGGTPRR